MTHPQQPTREVLEQALAALVIADNIALLGFAYSVRALETGARKIREAEEALRAALARHTPSTTGEATFLPPALHEGVIEHTVGDFTVKVSGLTIRQIKEIFEDKYHGSMMWSNGAAYPTDGVSIKFAGYSTPPQVEPAPEVGMTYDETSATMSVRGLSESAPRQMTEEEYARMTEKGAKAWAGVNAQDLRDGRAVPNQEQALQRLSEIGQELQPGEFEPVPSTAGEAERLYDAIKECLLHHRLQTFTGEDGEYYPLVDHLSHGDSIADGQHEIALICDCIYNEVLKPTALLQSTALPDHIPDAGKMLSEIRDIFPIPVPGSPLERAWVEAMGEPESVPDYVRECIAAMPVGELTPCNCRWDGEKQVQSCTLHDAHVDAIHDWAERAKAAEALRPAYLKNGMRFKISGSASYGVELLGMPADLIGQWVALVDATDNCHLAAARSQPVCEPLTIDEIDALADRITKRPAFADSWTVTYLQIRAFAKAILDFSELQTGSEQAEWKFVPIEPTQEMKRAAVVYANGNAVYKNVAKEALAIEEGIYGEVYQAMIKAAHGITKKGAL